jgi:hypothetical protein
MPIHMRISRVCFVGSLFGICLAGCNYQGTAGDSHGDRTLQGKWKETGINMDKAMPQDESNLVGMMLMFEPGVGGRVYSYSATELIVTDSTGAEVHRWPYVLKDSLLIFGTDTAKVRWGNEDAFKVYSDGVSMSYQRLPGEGH